MWIMRKSLLSSLLCVPLTTIGAEYDSIYAGRYTWGSEVHVFEPCDSEKAYWVSASSWVKGPLLDFYRRTTTEAYQPIYIEFRGHMLDEDVDGFAADYDGLIRISEIKKKVPRTPKECK